MTSIHSATPPLHLNFDVDFAALYSRDGLVKLDQIFCDWLAGRETGLYNRLMAARAAAPEPKAASQLLIDLAPCVEDFIARLFGIEADLLGSRARLTALAPLYRVKRLFVQRRAAKEIKPEILAEIDPGIELARLGLTPTPEADLAAFELAFACAVEGWQADATANAPALAAALRYAAWALLSPAGRARHRGGLLFKQPHKLDPAHLVPVETIDRDGVRMYRLPPDQWRRRDGFALTDPGCDVPFALDQVNYCIWCHNQGKDSCSKGLKEKDGRFKTSPLGTSLAGCPLEEKISEFQAVRSTGGVIGALAIIVIDNPMCAATGHRICNDCMKACIYQKQEPVDIPQSETRTLKDVLALPWGVEIYSLLTRWNPLDFARPLPRPASGAKVLVVGQGPAGYTLAHHLMNDGHHIVAIDGLKIEPLPETLGGVRQDGTRVPFAPIHDAASLVEPLDARMLAGFGGVSEYGITVRWDKNFLKLIRLLLERRAEYALFGGVRFGSTLTAAQAFGLGFDHIALCAGAGRPTVLDIPNKLARGVRQASDFLMALQLTGAAKAESLANLQLRLPVVVIGGGLTAIDTATESLAYYVVQVEKFLARHEALLAAGVRPEARWTEEEQEIAATFLAHGQAIRAERHRAAAAGEAANFVPLLTAWGGATVAYRRKLTDAPSYTLNHEEVAKALEEGVTFLEQATPLAVELDRFGATSGLTLRLGDGAEAVLPARAVLVAAGTQPNTVLAREDDAHARLDGKYFRALSEDGTPVAPERSAKPKTPQPIMHLEPDGRAISFWGDLHPSFAGNVVKAMGGAKQGYPVVSRLLARRAPTPVTADELGAILNDGLRARIVRVDRLTPTIVDVVVRAPFAAANFQPGMFYRLQNYEANAPVRQGTRMAMEGLALTGAEVDERAGTISTIVLEMGGSSNLCAHLQPGEPVVLMGPAGTATETPGGETVLLVGGGLGNAVLFSIGRALRAAGSRVLYVAGYKKLADRYKVAAIESAADQIIWCCDEAPGFTPTRPQDRGIVANIVDAIRAYGAGELGPINIPLNEIDRIIAIGSDRMMAAVAAARHQLLAPYLRADHAAIGSINSPMQCMMKEICAQCLQTHRDPVTGIETTIFSCTNQDQPLDVVDWTVLNDRLKQNSLAEKITCDWIAHCLHPTGATCGT